MWFVFSESPKQATVFLPQAHQWRCHAVLRGTVTRLRPVRYLSRFLFIKILCQKSCSSLVGCFYWTLQPLQFCTQWGILTKTLLSPMTSSWCCPCDTFNKFLWWTAATVKWSHHYGVWSLEIAVQKCKITGATSDSSTFKVCLNQVAQTHVWAIWLVAFRGCF